MSLEFSNAQGQIHVSEQAIATIVGACVSECYGVLGMSSKKRLKDGVAELLGKDNFSRGIVIQTTDNNLSISIHIIVMYGIKISEVSFNIQEKVKFSIEQMLELQVDTVNVVVEDVRVASPDKKSKEKK